MNSKNVIQLPMFTSEKPTFQTVEKSPATVSQKVDERIEPQSTKVDNVIPFPQQMKVSLQPVDCPDWQQRVSRLVDLALARAKAVQCEELEITTNAAGTCNTDGALIQTTETSGGRTG